MDKRGQLTILVIIGVVFVIGLATVRILVKTNTLNLGSSKVSTTFKRLETKYSVIKYEVLE